MKALANTLLNIIKARTFSCISDNFITPLEKNGLRTKRSKLVIKRICTKWSVFYVWCYSYMVVENLFLFCLFSPVLDKESLYLYWNLPQNIYPQDFIPTRILVSCGFAKKQEEKRFLRGLFQCSKEKERLYIFYGPV